MKKPNFFVIGAPKCGTTSLAYWLAEHPNIYMSPLKEPHFFNTDGLRWTRTLKEYESLFAGAEAHRHKAVGEASVRYLFSRTAVSNIIEYQPQAKFLVCIRNPIDMCQSLHAQLLFVGYETERDFKKAWFLQFERQRGKNIPLTARADPNILQYGAYCKLGDQLMRLYRLVPEERVLVLVLDDMSSAPRTVYRKVLSFLGVADDGRMIFPAHNQRKAPRSQVMCYFSALLQHAAHRAKAVTGIKRRFGFINALRSFNRTLPHERLLPATFRKELATFFENDIHLLEELLGRDFSSWLK